MGPCLNISIPNLWRLVPVILTRRSPNYFDKLGPFCHMILKFAVPDRTGRTSFVRIRYISVNLEIFYRLRINPNSSSVMNQNILAILPVTR